MGHLIHLMLRCDGDVMESDVFVEVFGGSKRGLGFSMSFQNKFASGVCWL